MNTEVVIMVSGKVQMRFVPHAVQADEFVTPRGPRPPAAPPGATVYYGGEIAGTVRCVRREPFSRWAIVYNPPERISTPLDALGAHVNQRVIATLAKLPAQTAPIITVEELASLDDETLLALDGIGTATLRNVRAACAQVLAK